MTNEEFQSLKARVDGGEALPVVDAFLFEQEQNRRARKPNALQQMLAERRRNPLLPATRTD